MESTSKVSTRESTVKASLHAINPPDNRSRSVAVPVSSECSAAAVSAPSVVTVYIAALIELDDDDDVFSADVTETVNVGAPWCPPFRKKILKFALPP